MNSSISNDNQCPICFNQLANPAVRCCDNGHFICMSDYQQMVKNGSDKFSCPMCRQINDIIPVAYQPAPIINVMQLPQHSGFQAVQTNPMIHERVINSDIQVFHSRVPITVTRTSHIHHREYHQATVHTQVIFDDSVKFRGIKTMISKNYYINHMKDFALDLFNNGTQNQVNETIRVDNKKQFTLVMQSIQTDNLSLDKYSLILTIKQL